MQAVASGTVPAHYLEVAGKSRFLVVVWAAGGNVVPAAGIARTLSLRGHDVRALGPAVLRARFEKAGCTFRPFVRAREPHRIEEEAFDDNLLGWTRYISGTRLADDVSEELAREPVEAVVVDAFLSAALCAAEATGVPTAALVHVLYQPCIEGATASQWDPVRPLVDATRRYLKLPPLDETTGVLSALWEKTSRVLACVPERFDYPLASFPSNLAYVGPVFDDTAERPPARRARRLVLVSFSTTDMGQGHVLQRVLDALEPLDLEVLCTLGGVEVGTLRRPENATICDWLPHMAVLSGTSAVVTHAGLSTVMTALAAGVPLLCMPVGRDQPLNADRVATLGVGRRISAESSVEEIRDSLEEVLANTSLRDEARRMAEVIGAYGNGATAARELEALL